MFICEWGNEGGWKSESEEEKKEWVKESALSWGGERTDMREIERKKGEGEKVSVAWISKCDHLDLDKEWRSLYVTLYHLNCRAYLMIFSIKFSNTVHWKSL